MRLLSKSDLLARILYAIREGGWSYRVVEASHPFLINVSNQGKSIVTRIYIWNITHGGGKARAPDEYRIQITSVDRIDVGPEFKTLLLGWDERYKIFAGYNAHRYTTFGASPSLQIKEKYLKKAAEAGIAVQTKEKYGKDDVAELAVAIRQDMLVPYITNLEEYHKPYLTGREAELLAKASSGEVKEPDLNILPKERRKVIMELNQAIRNVKFRKAVLYAYDARCAVCGVQLGIVEACHIVPVSEEGTDEPCNGIALCPNHHKALDIGLLFIHPNYRIIVNKLKVKELLQARLVAGVDSLGGFDGKKILLPEKGILRPRKEYLKKRLTLQGFQPSL